jgi:hypothetical protein
LSLAPVPRKKKFTQSCKISPPARLSFRKTGAPCSSRATDFFSPLSP